MKIEVVAASDEKTPRLAVWLAAWLAGQLQWTPLDRPDRSAGSLKARFRSATGDVSVKILTQADPTQSTPRILSTALTTRTGGPCGAESFALRRAADLYPEVRVEIDSTAYCTLPRTVLVPVLDPADRVSAALESSRNDPPFQSALPHALWLLGA